MLTGSFRGFDVALEPQGIVVITFNTPERLNGLTVAIKRDLMEVIAQAQMDETVRVVVFTGSGRAFSAGDDITADQQTSLGMKGLVPDIPQGYNTAKCHGLGVYDALKFHAQPLNWMVRNLDKLTIAAVNGYAIQTGMSLALSCDFRIASTEAKIGSGTLRFGLMPDEGGQFLVTQLVGVAKAMDFFMRNRIVSGEEAAELGLVHEVAPPEELMNRTMELARELANGPQVSMRLLKRSIYNAAEMTFAHALEDIASKTAISDQEPDAEEGMAAWREKRPPQFNKWIEELEAEQQKSK